MKNYYDRQIQLWGSATQKELQQKHIVIVGCGGLGCGLAVSLGNSGIGKITLIDFDIIEVHNIHRQVAFTYDDIGKKKCEVLKQFIKSRNQFIEIITVDGDFQSYVDSNINVLPDLVLDATDNLNVRVEIDKYSKSISKPWIYGSVEEFYGQICFFDQADFDSLFGVKDVQPKGIAAPMVMNIASFQANFAIRYLTNYPVDKDMLYYVSFDNNGTYILQKFALSK